MSILRPRYHFTPPQNFMNDPNGLIFYKGEYHLFYQHNPFGDTWGHMSWGHAISRDLVHWEHLPIALYEEDNIMIFSGSAVVDWNNTSGLGSENQPPLVALYTGHSQSEQTQNIAYSTDCGRTWVKYPGNPVIAIGSSEFRDPKVIWHEPTKHWVMITVLADQHKVRFFTSHNLKDWTHLSDFGPAGAVDGLWECPDLFALSIEGQPHLRKWVLKVDVLKGSGAQYFVGNFDGTHFINAGEGHEVLRVDHGRDFYAAQSWSDTLNDRRIWIAWMNNWEYANAIPTSPWRGAFSIPRELGLRLEAGRLHLIQKPIDELQQLRQSLYHAADLDLSQVNADLSRLKPNMAREIKVEFTLGSASEFGIVLGTGEAQQTLIGYDLQAQEMFVDRRRSGDSSFSSEFAGVHRALLPPQERKIRLHVFLDTCTVEVFGNDGRAVISDLIFPDPAKVTMQLYADEGDVHLNVLEVWELGDPA